MVTVVGGVALIVALVMLRRGFAPNEGFPDEFIEIAWDLSFLALGTLGLILVGMGLVFF